MSANPAWINEDIARSYSYSHKCHISASNTSLVSVSSSDQWIKHENVSLGKDPHSGRIRHSPSKIGKCH